MQDDSPDIPSKSIPEEESLRFLDENVGTPAPSETQHATEANTPETVVPFQRQDLSERLPLGRWSPAHPDYTKVLRWVGLIRSSIVFAILAAVSVPVWFSDLRRGGWYWLWILGCLTLVGISLIHALLWPSRIFRALRYRADETGVEIREGVIWQSDVIVASSRIQHTEVVRGPLQRAKGLSTLVIHTAGSSHDTVDLPGLSDELAQNLRDWLIAESARARRN